MARVVKVVWALPPLPDLRDALVLVRGCEALPLACEQLVGVGLMASIPYELVARRVEDGVECDGELHGCEVAREVPPPGGHRLDDGFANLGGERLKLLLGKVLEALRPLNRGENGPHL